MRKVASIIAIALMMSNVIVPVVLAEGNQTTSIMTITNEENKSEVVTNKNGMYINIAFNTEQKDVAYIPEFTIKVLSDKGGTVLGTAIANSNNYDKAAGKYKLWVNIPKYKAGDKFRVALDKVDNVVTSLEYVGYKEDDNSKITSYSITKEQEAPILITENRYTLNKQTLESIEKGETADTITTLYGKEDAPIIMSLKTDPSKVVIMIKDEDGQPITNLPVKIQGLFTKEEIAATSNSEGLIFDNYSKIFPSFTVVPNKNGYKVLGDEEGIFKGDFLMLPIGKKPSSFTSFKVSIKNTGLDIVNKGGVIVDISTNSNTELSKNWSEVELTFKDKNGIAQRKKISLNNNRLSLADGTYTIKVAKNDFADVTLKTTSLTVKDGKGTIDLAVSPKYTLEVNKNDSDYKFTVLNLSQLKDKVYSGKSATIFAVAPWESYLIQDKASSISTNVTISPDSKRTVLTLGMGVVLGGTGKPVHTGDSLYIILAILIIAGATGGATYLRSKKLVKTNSKSFLSMFLVFALTMSMITAFTSQTAKAEITGAAGTAINNGAIALDSRLIVPDKVNINGVETQTKGVLQVGFLPVTADCKLTEDATADELATYSKFVTNPFMFYMAPDQYTDNLWKQTGYIKFLPDIYQFNVIFGKSPLNPDALPIDVEGREKKTLPNAVEASSSDNPFLKMVGISIAEKSLKFDNIGDSLNNNVKNIFIGEGKQEQRDAVFNGYLDLLRTRVSPGFADDVSKLYKENKVSFFVQSLATVRVNGVNEIKGHAFMPVHDIIEAVNYVRGLGLVTKEWEAIEKNKTVYPYGHTAVNCGDPLCAAYGHIPYAGVLQSESYCTALQPFNQNVTGKYPSNKLGAWGFLHWNQENSTNLSENPKITADLDVTILDKNGVSTGENFIVPVEEWQEKDKRELIKLIDENNLDNSTVSGAMTFKHNEKIYAIQPQNNALVELYDVLDKEPLNKNPLSKSNTAETLRINLPFYNDTTSWKLILMSDILPSIKDLHEYLGGASDTNNQDMSWMDSDYYELYLQSIGETVNITPQENKYSGKTTEDGKPLSSDAKAVIHVTVKDETPKSLNPEDYAVPEWRLSKYWDNISATIQNKATFGMTLSPDDTASHASTSLSPSGLAFFNLVNPNLSGASWAQSKAKWVGGDTGVASITHDNTYAQMKVGGDLLATRVNNGVDNIKSASWVDSFPLIYGIGTTAIGAAINQPTSIDKTFTFKYGVENLLEYSHIIPHYSHSIGNDYNPITKTGGPFDVCNCFTTTETPVKNYTSADYDKTVRFYRYSPKTSSAKTLKNATGSSNGLFWEVVQDSSILKVNPEVAMAFDDNFGNTSVGFVAGDKVRDIKPSSYNVIKVNADVRSSGIGVSSATDSKAKTLAASLGAGGKQVLYKGSVINGTFEINGDITAKSFSLDIGNTVLKNTWNPGNTYSTEKNNEKFLSKFATKESNNKWSINVSKDGRLKINGVEYGNNVATETVSAGTKVIQHKLEVRSGKLTKVDGKPVGTITGDLKTAIEKMGLLGADSVFSSFEKGTGAKIDEPAVVELFNAVRNTSDLTIGSGWYQEDSTAIILSEYTTTFQLPKSHMFSDKVPMTVQGLETPMDKNLFFSKGYPGHLTLTFNLPIASYKYDSTGKEIDYIVPNVSILDTTN